ncbi:hypothetical protein O3P69_001123 [Scylla paramamosain]|uniref:G-protein coupled receptors family 1 profile domain-containing protein n=1 Tax=Scylla paramamosain TaxID=85552 RepID=A0AAW0USZ5_SCYPA
MNGSDPPRVLTLPPTPLASRPSFELKNPCRFPNATLLSSLCGGGSNSISDVIEKGTDLQNTTSSAVAPYAPSTLSTLSSSPLSPAAPSSPAYPLYEDYYEYEHYNFTDEQWGVVRQLNLYYVPLLIVVGFVGNLLSCVVFLNTRLRMRSSSYYLAALAVADVTYLFILFLVWLDLLGFNTFNVNVMCQLEIYLGSVSSSLSVWLTVAFTVERFIAVQYPLQRPTVCTVHRAKTVILTLTGFSVTVHLYVFVTAGVIVHHDEVSGVWQWRFRRDQRHIETKQFTVLDSVDRKLKVFAGRCVAVTVTVSGGMGDVCQNNEAIGLLINTVHGDAKKGITGEEVKEGEGEGDGKANGGEGREAGDQGGSQKVKGSESISQGARVREQGVRGIEGQGDQGVRGSGSQGDEGASALGGKGTFIGLSTTHVRSLPRRRLTRPQVFRGAQLRKGGVPITECNLRMDYRGLMNVINWVDTLLTLVVPFIMIVVMNTLIARQLIRFSKRYRNRDDVFHLQEVNGGQANGHKSGGTSSHSHSGRGGAGPCHSASSGTGRGGGPRQPPPSSSSSTTKNNNNLKMATHFASSAATVLSYTSKNPRSILSTRTQYSITKMLLLISTVFIILNLPSHVIRVHAFLSSLWGSEQAADEVLMWNLQQLFMQLQYTHFSINFVFYSTCGATFRKCLFQLLPTKVNRLVPGRVLDRVASSPLSCERREAPHLSATHGKGVKSVPEVQGSRGRGINPLIPLVSLEVLVLARPFIIAAAAAATTTTCFNKRKRGWGQDERQAARKEDEGMKNREQVEEEDEVELLKARWTLYDGFVSANTWEHLSTC